jgi:hypothetical protein
MDNIILVKRTSEKSKEKTLAMEDGFTVHMI